MTKNLGTDYDRREQRKQAGAMSWAIDLLTPLVLVGISLMVGRYFFST